ncbi:hypothetical protein V9T40_014537 [Parthenolecanium corni]|uniref:Uncharacterized protein n=1 Tax=Parthenolecanium corni TaxID=536013 RepID=A0AAN9T723_9HEMI
MGSLRRNRGMRNSSQLTPVPAADDDEEAPQTPASISKAEENKEAEISISVEDERLQPRASPAKTQMNHISHNIPNDVFSEVPKKKSRKHEWFWRLIISAAAWCKEITLKLAQ